MLASRIIGVTGWEVFSRGDDVAEESVMEGKPPNPPPISSPSFAQPFDIRLMFLLSFGLRNATNGVGSRWRIRRASLKLLNRRAYTGQCYQVMTATVVGF